MRITKTIPLDADRMSRELLRGLAPGEELTAHCETLCDVARARNSAYELRQLERRPDGHTYAVSTSNVRGTVTVSLVRETPNTEEP